MATLSGARDIFQAQVLLRGQIDDAVAILAVFLVGLAYATKGVIWDRSDPHHYKLFEKPQQRADVARFSQQSNNLAKRLETEGADIAILWASQSGTAERLAERLAKDLRKSYGAKVLPLDISEVTPASLNDVSRFHVVIFIASTFGEGDPSDNMHQMWSWFRTNWEDSLVNVRFLAFGLGNSNYKHYNHVIDVLEAELLQRGAHMLMDTGRADDSTGQTMEHFVEWKQKIFELFDKDLGYERRLAHYEPSIQVTEDASIDARDSWSGTPPPPKVSKQSEYSRLPIIECRDLLHNSSDRQCIHLTVDISQKPNLKYKTGDYLAVWPINPAQEVQILLEVFGLQEKRTIPINIKPLNSDNVHIPSPTTIEAIFQSYVEICAPVFREVIDDFITYAPTIAAQEMLRSISQSRQSYENFAKTRYVNLGRLLSAACPTPGAWRALPLSLVLETLPSMQPRFYSISSSSVVSPRKISIAVAATDTTTADSPDRVIGLATNYLLSASGEPHPRGLTYSQALPSSHIYAAVRKSTFKLPISSSAPVVMVGAGTGVAPFRAFVQERARLKSMGREVGRTRLFFGCRNASQDLLYAGDWSDWASILGTCFSLTTAFSRPEVVIHKRYVQDSITEDAEAVCKLLVDENAYFYICGSSAMARDVSAAVAKMIQTRQGWTDEQFKEFADRRKRQRRWLQDVWG